LNPLYVRVNIIITHVVIRWWLYIVTTDGIKIVVKIGKIGYICVLQCSLFAPCNKHIIVMGIIL